MCLTNAKKVRRRGQGPITAYKIIGIRKYKDGRKEELFSPYTHFKWVRGQVIPAIGHIKLKDLIFHREIHGGAFHAFKNLDDAAWDLASIGNTPYLYFEAPEVKSTRYVIAEVEIPQDSRVYVGKYDAYSFSDPVDCYASTKMKLGKIIMERKDAVDMFLKKKQH